MAPHLSGSTRAQKHKFCSFYISCVADDSQAPLSIRLWNETTTKQKPHVIYIRLDRVEKKKHMNMNCIVVLSLVLFLSVSKTMAQPSQGPPSLTKILEDAGDFSDFLRLLKTTHMAGQIATQLQNSNDGLTILVPPDPAFSSLKSGSLNSLGDKQLVQLIQFHVIPQFLTKPLFQTVSNPLRTLADGNNDGAFPLNITVAGNELKVSTGIDEATVGESLYSGNQLAVYRIDHILLPPSIFTPPSAPAPERPEKKQPAPLTTSSAPKKIVDGQCPLTVGFAAVLLLLHLHCGVKF